MLESLVKHSAIPVNQYLTSLRRMDRFIFLGFSRVFYETTLKQSKVLFTTFKPFRTYHVSEVFIPWTFTWLAVQVGQGKRVNSSAWCME